MPKKPTCKFCNSKEDSSKEKLLQCATCKGFCHPSCLELPENIVATVRTYDWQCNDCKYCYQCQDIANEEQILFCDTCDRGYHMYCVTPKLKRKPKGDWYCPVCVENQKKASEENSENRSEAEESQMDVDIEEGENEEENKKSEEVEQTHKMEQPGKSKNTPSKYTPTKACPFPGCDGSGHIKSTSSVHFTLKTCPIARDERRRERELLGMNRSGDEKNKENSDTNSQPSPPKTSKSSKSLLKDEEINKDDSPTSSKLETLNPNNQTPIEHIVSRTDLELFEKAKQKAAEITALEKDMAPALDGLKIAVFGEIEIEAWYKSHYPLEFCKLPRIFICEFCLSYLQSETIYKRHMEKCVVKHPPGEEIYRKDNLSVFEVDGKSATVYCQNLCLFAKMFLDHKTLWNDVAPFLFYVMTIADERGCNIVGYFSKEKVSFLNYNVSCILVLPQHMRKGYGKLLIEFSYLLSQQEGKTGSPERPLSDLGLITYRKFWQDKLLNYLMDYTEDNISIKGISEKMALHPNDIVSTLQFLGMLKYWRGTHKILLRREIIEEYASKVKQRPGDYKEIDRSCLKWTAKTYK